MTTPGEHQPVLDAIDQLLESLRRNADRADAIADRAAQLRAELSDGHRLAEVVTREPRPLIIELITESLNDLQDTGVHLRRVEARALREEGLTTEEIAALFGVTRQRVSALLRPT